MIAAAARDVKALIVALEAPILSPISAKNIKKKFLTHQLNLEAFTSELLNWRRKILSTQCF